MFSFAIHKIYILPLDAMYIAINLSEKKFQHTYLGSRLTTTGKKKCSMKAQLKYMILLSAVDLKILKIHTYIKHTQYVILTYLIGEKSLLDFHNVSKDIWILHL